MKESDFRTDGSCLYVLLPGELDHPASDCIRRETERIMNRRDIRSIVFDFADTTFMDSSGIGLIMGRYRALGMRKDCVRAVHVSSYMEKLLRLSGVHKYIGICEETEKIGEGEGEHHGKHQ